MLTDIWAHRFKEDPKLLEVVEDEDFDPDEVADLIGYRGDDPADGDDPDDWEDVQ